MNTKNRLSKVLNLIKTAGLALLLAMAWNGTQALAEPHTIPVAAGGLAYGESLRVALTNTSARAITAVATTLDATGAVVKQQSFVVPAGQIITFTTSFTDAGGTAAEEQAKQLRTQVTVQNGDDANDLLVASHVVEQSTGAAKVNAGIARLAGNHNETMVRDTR